MATAADQSASPPVTHASFAAFRHPGFRMYFAATAAAMLADNIEHVVSYWVIYQKFHSPTLGGFAVISHWLPFLAFSVYSGALADRFDPRRIIQVGMLLFMGVRLPGGVVFQWCPQSSARTHPAHCSWLRRVLWGPASQLRCMTLSDPAELQSAVRLGATARYLGTFLGPAVGSALLLTLGPSHAIWVNAAIYLPMVVWLWRAPYGPRFRKSEAGAEARPKPQTVRGFADVFATFRVIRENRTVLCMTLLAGGAAFFVGNAYQAQMPGFASIWVMANSWHGLLHVVGRGCSGRSGLGRSSWSYLGFLQGRPRARHSPWPCVGVYLSPASRSARIMFWRSSCCFQQVPWSCRSIPWHKRWCSWCACHDSRPCDRCSPWPRMACGLSAASPSA